MNPEYHGLSINCQFYVRALVVFLLDDGHGERLRKLPPPESPGTLLTRANRRSYGTMDA